MRSYRKTAYHEAGHAVGHFFHHLSGRPRGIVIGGEQLSEYNAGKHEVNQVRGFHSVSKTFPAIVNRSVDREQLRQEIMTLLAGPAAGYLYAGSAKKRLKPSKAQLEEKRRHGHGRDDYTRVFTLLCDADPFDPRAVIRGIPEEERERLSPKEAMEQYVEPALRADRDRVLDEVGRYEREAFDFVASKWPHIQTLADAAFKQKVLAAEEVIAIIERVEQRLHDGPPQELWRPEP